MIIAILSHYEEVLLMAGEILRGKRRLCFGNWRCDAQKVVQANYLLRAIYLGEI